MEFQAGTKAKCPNKAVRRHCLGFDHLSLRHELAVDAVECIPDQQPGVAGDVGGSPNRVEIRDVGMRHETQRPRRRAL